MATQDYTLDVQTNDNKLTVASYSAPLSTLKLEGAAVTVVASGFLDPSKNSNGPAFGLYAALPAGGDLVALPPVDGPKARVQIIHNSADAAADSVDVYLNGDLLLNDFAFRNATSYVDVPATQEIKVAVAAKNSMSVNDAIESFDYNLGINETYVIVAEGIVSTSGYSPATPFDLKVYAMGREEATNTMNTDVLVHHGSTDAPCVDVEEASAGRLVDNACYGDFSNYLELPTDDYQLIVKDTTGMNEVAAFNAPLKQLSLEGKALVVVASGFLAPENNSNGPAFGLYVALPTGGEMVELPASSNASVNTIDLKSIGLFPNPANDRIQLEGVHGQNTHVRIIDNFGRNVMETEVRDGVLNISNLNTGSYYLQIKQDNETIGFSRFIKL